MFGWQHISAVNVQIWEYVLCTKYSFNDVQVMSSDLEILELMLNRRRVFADIDAGMRRIDRQPSHLTFSVRFSIV